MNDIERSIMQSRYADENYSQLRAVMDKMMDERLAWIKEGMAKVEEIIEAKLALYDITFEDIIAKPDQYKMLKEIYNHPDPVEHHERYSINGIKLIHVIWTPTELIIQDDPTETVDGNLLDA